MNVETQPATRYTMQFLLPVGGIIDHRFGILATPASYGIPSGIRAGMKWAADNQAFTKGFRSDVYFPWLKTMEPYKSTCLFVAVPDAVGNASETLRLFERWHGSFAGWPLAFVAQDGQEALEFPSGEWSNLFVGGSTVWKLSDAAVSVIQRAQRLGKHIHIGRVNWKRRYEHFAGLPGGEEFTADGTRTRYERDRAIVAWAEYMAAPRQLRLPVPDRYHPGQPDRGVVGTGGDSD